MKLDQIQLLILLYLFSINNVCAFTTEPSAQKPDCAIIDVDNQTYATDDTTNVELQAIGELLQMWRTAVLNGDTQAIMDLVTEDAIFWSHGAVPLIGRQELADAFAPFLKQYKYIQNYNCQELVIRGDRAFIRGTEKNIKKPHAGGDTVISMQRAFSILHRSADGRWRFARGMTNTPPKLKEE
ncbi:MAG: SgcJ/EcaC family oxidoreductase [Proteobacteria bacterium]|nr:MAG: SgcJ/EcaC family oxidoreductase [Pseudomonadota bacterium]